MTTYKDPVKQKSREKQREFIAKNLLSFKKPKDVRVVCFPGAEAEGEEALEVKEIYDSLGIPRQNIVGLEADPERAKRLRKAELGIIVEQKLDLDFFKETGRQFDIISLDYTGYRDESKWQALHQIAGRQILYGNGILCTNYSANRESKKYQKQLFLLQQDLVLHDEENGNKPKSLEQEIKSFIKGEKDLDLKKIRDALTYRTLMIMRMGTSALKGIKLLTTHQNYDEAQKVLKKFEEEEKETDPLLVNFCLENRYESGMGNAGHSHPLSYLYRKMNMELLGNFIMKNNGINKNLANFFVDYLVEKEMKAQYPKNIERYSYISNKNTRMEMDLISFMSAERFYKKFNNNVIYNPETGKLTLINLNNKKLFEIWKEVRKQKHFDVPERIYLGSSWESPKRKERISKGDAIDLLRSGCSPAEISECYRGFTKMQLAAFKAHYITMGKEIL